VTLSQLAASRDFVSRAVAAIPPSGIRRFFDIAATMQGVISLGVGEPDFVTPTHVIEAAKASLDRGKTGYTSNRGLVELRERIAHETATRYGAAYNPLSEIIVTTGVSEAFDLAVRATIDPNDEVIVPEPSYVCYPPCVALTGGVVVPIRTGAEHDFVVTARQVAEVITPRTKAIVLGYPNNPTGGAVSRDELAAIVRLAVEHDLLIISDEIYSRLTYDGWEHTCVASLPGAHERTILLNGFSKAYAMTGWRLGYACAPSHLIEAMMKVHQYGMLCAPTMAQYAAIEALENGEAAVQRMIAEYARRRQLIVDRLNHMGLDCFRPQGAFYVFPSIRRTGLSSDEFAERFLREERVAAIPGAVFGHGGEGHVRMCYATKYEQIDEALDRLGRFLGRVCP
jgi:aminotransferase